MKVQRTKKIPARGTQIPAIAIIVGLFLLTAIVIALGWNPASPSFGKSPTPEPSPTPYLPVIMKGKETRPLFPMIWKGTIPTQTPKPVENSPTSSNTNPETRPFGGVITYTYTLFPHPFWGSDASYRKLRVRPAVTGEK